MHNDKSGLQAKMAALESVSSNSQSTLSLKESVIQNLEKEMTKVQADLEEKTSELMFSYVIMIILFFLKYRPALMNSLKLLK